MEAFLRSTRKRFTQMQAVDAREDLVKSVMQRTADHLGPKVAKGAQAI